MDSEAVYYPVGLRQAYLLEAGGSDFLFDPEDAAKFFATQSTQSDQPSEQKPVIKSYGATGKKDKDGKVKPVPPHIEEYHKKLLDLLRQSDKLDDHTLAMVKSFILKMRDQILARTAEVIARVDKGIEPGWGAYWVPILVKQFEEVIKALGVKFGKDLTALMGGAAKVGIDLGSAGWDAAKHGIQANKVKSKSTDIHLPQPDLDHAAQPGHPDHPDQIHNLSLQLPKLSADDVIIGSMFSADLITKMSKSQIDKVSQQVSLSVALGESPARLINRLAEFITKEPWKSVRAKAEAIARTEMSRIQDLGRALRQYQQQAQFPEVKQYYQWVVAPLLEWPCDECRPYDGLVYELDGTPVNPNPDLAIVDFNEHKNLEEKAPACPLHVHCRCVKSPFILLPEEIDVVSPIPAEEEEKAEQEAQKQAQEQAEKEAKDKADQEQKSKEAREWEKIQAHAAQLKRDQEKKEKELAEQAAMLHQINGGIPEAIKPGVQSGQHDQSHSGSPGLSDALALIHKVEQEIKDKLTAGEVVEFSKDPSSIPPGVSLHGIEFSDFPSPGSSKSDPSSLPKDYWSSMADKTNIHEPVFANTSGKKISAGCIMVEEDGSLWLVEPTGHFGGYKNTYPKGGQEPGFTLQQTALKETWEESGMEAEILAHLGDYEKTTTMTRYYLAKRKNGKPTNAGWESQGIKLSPQSAAKMLLGQNSNSKVDLQVFDDLVKHLTEATAAQPGKNLHEAIEANSEKMKADLAVGNIAQAAPVAPVAHVNPVSAWTPQEIIKFARDRMVKNSPAYGSVSDISVLFNYREFFKSHKGQTFDDNGEKWQAVVDLLEKMKQSGASSLSEHLILSAPASVMPAVTAPVTPPVTAPVSDPVSSSPLSPKQIMHQIDLKLEAGWPGMFTSSSDLSKLHHFKFKFANLKDELWNQAELLHSEMKSSAAFYLNEMPPGFVSSPLGSYKVASLVTSPAAQPVASPAIETATPNPKTFLNPPSTWSPQEVVSYAELKLNTDFPSIKLGSDVGKLFTYKIKYKDLGVDEVYHAVTDLSAKMQSSGFSSLSDYLAMPGPAAPNTGPNTSITPKPVPAVDKVSKEDKEKLAKYLKDVAYFGHNPSKYSGQMQNGWTDAKDKGQKLKYLAEIMDWQDAKEPWQIYQSLDAENKAKEAAKIAKAAAVGAVLPVKPAEKKIVKDVLKDHYIPYNMSNHTDIEKLDYIINKTTGPKQDLANQAKDIALKMEAEKQALQAAGKATPDEIKGLKKWIKDHNYYYSSTPNLTDVEKCEKILSSKGYDKQTAQFYLDVAIKVKGGIDPNVAIKKAAKTAAAVAQALHLAQSGLSNVNATNASLFTWKGTLIGGSGLNATPYHLPPIDHDQAKKIQDQGLAERFSMSMMNIHGSQMGGNKGGQATYSDGSEWYVKICNDPERAKSEKLAADLYKLANAHSAEMILVDAGNGKINVGSKFVDGLKNDRSAITQDEGVMEDFAADCWLANWDVIGQWGSPNVKIDKDGKPFRFDPGGALEYRALESSGKKTDFGDTVTEWNTLRMQTATTNAEVFNKITEDQMVKSARKIQNIKPEQVRDAALKAGYSLPDAVRLAEKMEKRRQDVIARAQALLNAQTNPIHGQFNSESGPEDLVKMIKRGGSYNATHEAQEKRTAEFTSMIGRDATEAFAECMKSWQGDSDAGGGSNNAKVLKDEWEKMILGKPTDRHDLRVAIQTQRFILKTMFPGGMVKLYRGFGNTLQKGTIDFEKRWRDEAIIGALLGKKWAALTSWQATSWCSDPGAAFRGLVAWKVVSIDKILGGMGITPGFNRNNRMEKENEYILSANHLEGRDSKTYVYLPDTKFPGLWDGGGGKSIFDYVEDLRKNDPGKVDSLLKGKHGPLHIVRDDFKEESRKYAEFTHLQESSRIIVTKKQWEDQGHQMDPGYMDAETTKAREKHLEEIAFFAGLEANGQVHQIDMPEEAWGYGPLGLSKEDREKFNAGQEI